MTKTLSLGSLRLCTHSGCAVFSPVSQNNNRKMRNNLPALAIAVACTATGARAACSFCTAASDPSQQLAYDLSSLPLGPFVAKDSYGDEYFVSSPCQAFSPTATQCSGKGYQFPSPAFQMVAEYGCIPLGNSSMVRVVFCVRSIDTTSLSRCGSRGRVREMDIGMLVLVCAGLCRAAFMGQ